MAFIPMITSGFTARLKPQPSTSHRQMAKTTKSNPAINTENELVQSFLLIGNQMAATRPRAIRTLPLTNSQVVRSESCRRMRRIWPAMMPNNAVATTRKASSAPSRASPGKLLPHAQNMARHEAEQRRSDGRDGADDAFRVPGFRPRIVVAAQHDLVDVVP